MHEVTMPMVKAAVGVLIERGVLPGIVPGEHYLRNWEWESRS